MCASLQGAHICTHTRMHVHAWGHFIQSVPVACGKGQPSPGGSEESPQGPHGWCSLLRRLVYRTPSARPLPERSGRECRIPAPRREGLGQTHGPGRSARAFQPSTYSFLFTHGLAPERPGVLWFTLPPTQEVGTDNPPSTVAGTGEGPRKHPTQTGPPGSARVATEDTASE